MRPLTTAVIVVIAFTVGFGFGFVTKFSLQTCHWEYSSAKAVGGVTIMTPFKVCQ